MSIYAGASNSPIARTTQDQLEMIRISPLRILLQNFVFCTAIAAILWLFVPRVGQYGFVSNFVHAQSIGNSITLLAIGFTQLSISAGFSDRWSRLLSFVPATLLGAIFGLWLAGALLGLHNGPSEFLDDADNLRISALTAVLASFVFSWHLNRREKLMRLELLASEERRRADNAYHAMLRAQLDPHMLFNTLANLRALIGHDTSQALDMLDRLDSFLRETLRSSRSTHHILAHELKVLDDYLALMKVRMAERLSYSFSIAPSCESIQIPALILQPLIENAIRHGIEPLVEGGHIEISAQLENNTLTLMVEDNGAGINPDTGKIKSAVINNAQSLLSESDSVASDRFGLENLRQRLQQSYGDKASLQFLPAISSNTGAADSGVGTNQGTRVTIRLPAKIEV